jgi:hypothetical protein
MSAAVRRIHTSHLLPPRSTAGQLTLDQHIGVRIPGGQPKQSKQVRSNSGHAPLCANVGENVGTTRPRLLERLESLMGPLYDGLMHFLMSPEDIVPVLALALLARLRGASYGRRALFTVPAAWFLGGLLGLSAAASTGSPWPLQFGSCCWEGCLLLTPSSHCV